MAVETTVLEGDLPPRFRLLVLRLLEVSDGLDVGHDVAHLGLAEDRAKGRHSHHGLLPQLHLLGVLPDARGEALDDPLADLALVLGVSRENAAGPRRHVLQPVAGVGHPAVPSGTVAREATR